jgi:hypothetical protein
MCAGPGHVTNGDDGNDDETRAASHNRDRVLWLLLSGYLSYAELFARDAAPTCPTIGTPGTVFGQPPCVYGFFMYLAVLITALWGLASARRWPVQTTGRLDLPAGA